MNTESMYARRRGNIKVSIYGCDINTLLHTCAIFIHTDGSALTHMCMAMKYQHYFQVWVCINNYLVCSWRYGQLQVIRHTYTSAFIGWAHTQNNPCVCIWYVILWLCATVFPHSLFSFLIARSAFVYAYLLTDIYWPTQLPTHCTDQLSMQSSGAHD